MGKANAALLGIKGTSFVPASTTYPPADVVVSYFTHRHCWFCTRVLVAVTLWRHLARPRLITGGFAYWFNSVVTLGGRGQRDFRGVTMTAGVFQRTTDRTDETCGSKG